VPASSSSPAIILANQMQDQVFPEPFLSFLIGRHRRIKCAPKKCLTRSGTAKGVPALCHNQKSETNRTLIMKQTKGRQHTIIYFLFFQPPAQPTAPALKLENIFHTLVLFLMNKTSSSSNVRLVLTKPDREQQRSLRSLLPNSAIHLF
jgi:hypothetical protein